MSKSFLGIVKDNSQIFLFRFCPKWWFEKDVSFIFAWLTPNFLDIFSGMREVIVKEIQAMHIQMSWNFARSFIWSNHHSPSNMSSCNSSMWAQHQILVSGQIFSLWSNHILYCFNWAETLPRQASTYINYSQQVLPQLVDPITLCYFSKFLSKMKLYEASATLVFPNGMKYWQ